MPVLRSAFIALSKNRPLRSLCENTRFGRKMSSRFVAGMEIGDALRVTQALNQQGMHVTLDSLGESVSSDVEAHRAAEIYHQLLDLIANEKLDANISVKLTQMGLELSPALAEEIAESLSEHAAALGNFVRIDMEDSTLTQVTLDIVYRLHAKAELRGSIGIVIQAYLYRSQADIEQLVAEGIRVRLCKGAYKEPATLAFATKREVDTSYIRLMRVLLERGAYPGLATHDQRIIEEAHRFARERGIPPERYEFQMLYGIRRDLARRFVAEGYRIRLYVPFGEAWYPYFMRRLAERPANLLFLMRNMLKG